MAILSKLISYLIHPLLVPTFGTIFYFMVTPKYSPSELLLGNLIPIFILTALIPLGSLLILNQFGMTRSLLLLTSEERIYPLLIFLALLLLIQVSSRLWTSWCITLLGYKGILARTQRPRSSAKILASQCGNIRP